MEEKRRRVLQFSYSIKTNFKKKKKSLQVDKFYEATVRLIF